MQLEHLTNHGSGWYPAHWLEPIKIHPLWQCFFIPKGMIIYVFIGLWHLCSTFCSVGFCRWVRRCLGGGESVTGGWWLLRWLVRRQRYTRYASCVAGWVSWFICVISTYGSSWSVWFIRINLIRMVFRFWNL